jgi:hypothetical protein
MFEMEGVPGVARTVTADEGDDDGEVPPLFVAVTETVYDVPLDRPVMAHDVPDVVQVCPPGFAVAVEESTVPAGAVQDTTSDCAPLVEADTLVGAAGAGTGGVAGAIETDPVFPLS